MVPKIIHQIVGPSPSELVKTCLDSWAKIKPLGYQVKIWNDDSINRFVKSKFPYALEPILKARNHGEASDIARYLIIYYYGGHYMDWDIKLLNPVKFEVLCKNYKNGYLLVESSDGSIASECFSGIKGEKYLLSLVNDIIDIYKSGKRDWFVTPDYSGPNRMKWSLKKHLNTSQKIVAVKQLFAYNYHEIKSGFHLEDVKQPLMHHWVHSWVTFDE